mmetsp:Transcript_17808/g.44909  ORF Transcript_17808/g.44909 Transcript_17808/m.44909 type:complete len:126 (-) Transcript_17808:255-632(-)
MARQPICKQSMKEQMGPNAQKGSELVSEAVQALVNLKEMVKTRHMKCNTAAGLLGFTLRRLSESVMARVKRSLPTPSLKQQQPPTQSSSSLPTPSLKQQSQAAVAAYAAAIVVFANVADQAYVAA